MYYSSSGYYFFGCRESQ